MDWDLDLDGVVDCHISWIIELVQTCATYVKIPKAVLLPTFELGKGVKISPRTLI